MKTTIDIPEPLYRRAKIRSVERGRTLRQTVLEALERFLVQAEAEERAKPKKSFHQRRTLRPEFRNLLASGVFGAGTDSAQIVSEERDSREDALL
ncbi:MAG: hypothetical protein WD342_00660 [Verrucomicrobiales bacterium]